MGQVSVPVNGRSYAITCEDGQESRIRRLAQYVDAKVAEFVGSVVRPERAACCCSPRWSSPTSSRTPMTRSSGRTANAPKPRQMEETKRRSGSRLLRRGCRHPSFPDAEWGWAVR